MDRIRGTAASPGVARGPWVVIEARPLPTGRTIEPTEVEAEVARLRAASDAAATDLEAIAADVRATGHADEAEIFEAQASIARDPALEAAAEGRIREWRDDAVGAIVQAGTSFAEQLRAIGDELLAARAADVLDVVDRIGRRLTGTGGGGVPQLRVPSIVVAADLPPSITATLPRDRLLGLALEGSSPTAHAAILARAYAIPAVVEARGILEAVAGHSADPKASATSSRAGPEIALDGGTGEVVVDPDAPTRAEFEARAQVAASRRATDRAEATLPAVTADGTAVTLLANIGSPAETDGAIALGARGVGLFRTEFLFLERGSAPSEDEQTAAYRAVVEAFAPDPVTIRLLDVGGDKAIPYLPIAPEANPFLGVRALRLARDDRSLFVTQLRACYRAAVGGRVKVMAPMIADAGDAELLVALAADARRGLEDEGVPHGEVELGVMLEIPSAVLVADAYFDRLSFASLGTNDLLQYTLAVDRGNAALERYRESLHPAVLRLIAESVAAAARAGIQLSVCGEMAGDPPAALALVGLGIRSLSMAASSLPGVRRAIRASSLDLLERAARQALETPDPRDVRARFAELAARSAAAVAPAAES